MSYVVATVDGAVCNVHFLASVPHTWDACEVGAESMMVIDRNGNEITHEVPLRDTFFQGPSKRLPPGGSLSLDYPVTLVPLR